MAYVGHLALGQEGMRSLIMGTSPHAHGHSIRALIVVVALAFAGLALLSAPASAAITFPSGMVFQNDEEGANDEPGQKDLTRYGVDYSGLPSTVQVSWNWDETGWPGANTGDACALFDTDNDGKVNYSLCAIVEGDPAQYSGTRLYSCGDDKVDRCTQPITEIISFASTCDMEVTNTDPFPAGDEYPKDTSALCTAVMSDLGVTLTKTLVNVCSYPSGEPNSDPSDCVLVPRDGFLTIAKVANPDDESAHFEFRIDGSSDVVYDTYGSGSSSVIPVRSDIDHSIGESLPAGWSLASARCSNQSGTLDGTTLSGIAFESGESVTCTFTNDRLPTLTVVKEVVNDNSGSLAAADFSLHVKTDGSDVAGSPQPGDVSGTTYVLEPGDYVVGETEQAGYSSTVGGDCASDGSIALGVGDRRTCTIINNDDIHPSIAITKSADPTTIASGGMVEYTVVIENDGDDPLTEVHVSDDTCGPLAFVSGDDVDTGVLNPGERWTYTCSTTLTEDRINTASVDAEDSKGGTVSGSAIAEVDVTEQPGPTGETGATNDPGPTVETQAAPVVKVGTYSNCISRRYTVRPRITGGTPQVTVLSVDGKRKATSRSTKPKFVVDTRKHSVGRHRVRVEVTFTNGRKATTSATFERCKIKVAAPKFTG